MPSLWDIVVYELGYGNTPEAEEVYKQLIEERTEGE